jgi:hypothetical protein
MNIHILQYLFSSFFLFLAPVFANFPTPPDIWKDFDPDAGDFKEEIVYEKTVKGIYEKHAYISTYVNEVEIRVFCKYAVKEGSKNVPGLDEHSWLDGRTID